MNGDRTDGRRRVLAIGIDAAEPDLLRELADAGRLPTIAALRVAGREASLENTKAFRSEAVWTGFVTGRPSTEHGYWTNVEFDPSTYEVADIGASGLRPFWAGRGPGRTIVFDVPHTTLHPDDDAVVCTAWGAHSPLHPRASKPAGLLDEIDDRFGPHPGFGLDEVACWFDPDYLSRLRNALVAGALRRSDIVPWLWSRFPDWDLTVTAFSESHSIGHHGWHGVDDDHLAAGARTAPLAQQAVREVYEAIDASIARLVAAAPAGTRVVVFALHGMQTNTNDVPSTVLLPELLYRLATGDQRLVGREQHRWRTERFLEPRFTWGQELALRHDGGPAQRAVAATLDLLPTSVGRALLAARSRLTGSAPPRERFGRPAAPSESEAPPDRRQPIEWQPPTTYRPWWPEMPAFALPTFSDAHVRLNVAGREAAGLIDPEHYRAILDDLEANLGACTDARTGRPAVAGFHRPRETAPMAAGGPPPDLVVFWTPGIEAIDHPGAGRIGPVPMLRTGEHSSNGMCIVAGDDAHGTVGGTLDAAAVTGTIHDLLGMPTSAPSLLERSGVR